MSYCRWSSDDFACDLYCYADVNGGWTTHVAGSRYSGEIPKVEDALLSSDTEEYARQCQAQTDFLKDAQLVPIGLPYDGMTFRDPTLEAFRARVAMLIEAGYRCPEWLLASIDEEIGEESATRDEKPC